MRGKEELIERLAIRRRSHLKDLSESAYEELVRSVQAHPETFIEDPSDEAFALLVDALDRFGRHSPDEEFFDDSSFLEARTKRLSHLISACEHILSIDPSCIDAHLCSLLAQDLTQDELLDALLALSSETDDLLGELTSGDAGDAWGDVMSHGRIRLQAAIARTCIDSGRYRMAEKICWDLLALSPCDAIGARHTCALALSRLEDEEAFDRLDTHHDRHGDSWSHLGRVILLFKLGRSAAAKRALIGYTRLVEGGAYALLRPVYVDTYIPDRPEEHSCSFGEATLAVYEADPIIVDTPDLVLWAESIQDVVQTAHSFANLNGYDW
jgi:hypothetical protein